ncbi:MAG: hypothetical protein NTV52_17730 [Acidobacteria bacterium]|nr:hypothetical protein [Acidobacteriota bacterium]
MGPRNGISPVTGVWNNATGPPLVDTFRTFCFALGVAGRLLFQRVREVSMR